MSGGRVVAVTGATGFLGLHLVAALAREGALAVLDAAGGIGSDFERREVLVEVARRVPDDAVRARVLQLADELSDFERRQVEEAVGAVRG